MFAVAKCPTTPADIGLTMARMAATAVAAQMIRSRYTVLDLAAETGRLPALAAGLESAWSAIPDAHPAP
jgi:hypothetical protein